jgi:hypothetical protein
MCALEKYILELIIMLLERQQSVWPMSALDCVCVGGGGYLI